MVWQLEIDEIKRRVAMAKKMGGEEGIAVQHGRGKLTIRERLDSLPTRVLSRKSVSWQERRLMMETN